MKISTFIISMLLVALLVSVFGNYYAHIEEKYNVDYDANTTATINAFNQFDAIRNATEEINQTLFASREGGQGATDLLGVFLGGGFNVLKIATGSFSAFYTLLQNAMISVGLPSYFFNILLAIAVVSIFFIIVSVLVGRDV